MNIFFIFLIIVITAVILIIIVRKINSRGNEDTSGETIFDRGTSVAKNFKDCCIKGVKNIFGGGA